MKSPLSRSIDEHVGQFAPPIRARLRAVRREIRRRAPGATETISYGIPTFDLGGRHLVHFAGYRGHVGFYPTSSAVAAFSLELKRYPTSRGAVQFPHDEPLPLDLIGRMVAFRVAECAAPKPAKPAKPAKPKPSRQPRPRGRGPARPSKPSKPASRGG